MIINKSIMKEISNDEIRKIQIEILKDVDSFCRKEKLHYSLAYGTLIGAVRHKGFIPWDDDIDIIMPRVDYDRFIERYYSQRYDILNYKKDTRCHMPYMELCDNRTTLIHGRHTIGVFVDVFPIDGLPEESELNEYVATFLKKQKAVVRKRKPYKDSVDKMKEYLSYCIKNILYPCKRETYISDFESFYESHTIDNSPNAGCLSNYGVNGEKEIMPSYIFKEYIGIVVN